MRTTCCRTSPSPRCERPSLRSPMMTRWWRWPSLEPDRRSPRRSWTSLPRLQKVTHLKLGRAIVVAGLVSPSTTLDAMRISKRKSEYREGNQSVLQDSWYRLGGLIQTEYSVRPLSRPDGPGFIGHLALAFTEDCIGGVIFNAMPEDIASRSGDYDRTEINYIQFEGSYSGEEFGFSRELVVSPEFDRFGGWTVTLGESNSDKTQVGPILPEMIVADAICAEQVTISLGNRHRDSDGFVIQLLVVVPLRDMEVLRLSIADVLGQAYVERLLRMNGYQVLE